MAMQVQGTILDVLKKKMRQTKEEMEKYKDDCDEYQKRLQMEVMRREEVSCVECYFFSLHIYQLISHIYIYVYTIDYSYRYFGFVAVSKWPEGRADIKSH